MSVKIRLMRMGKTKQPSYRVVVSDSRSPRDGRNIETIGHYGPRQDPSLVDIDGEKALAWLRKGAQPTEQVQKLLTVTGVWAQFESEKGGPVDTKLARRRLGDPKVAAKKAKKETEKAEPAEAPAGDAEQPAAEEPAAEAASAADGSAGDGSEESGDE
ncbi:MAG TPA: 30S ribosomal protein S16 [Acidimicrobiia bacterium]|nr:30S ribosomal protein S16 [Acidimicrobiia bacterium]